MFIAMKVGNKAFSKRCRRVGVSFDVFAANVFQAHSLTYYTQHTTRSEPPKYESMIMSVMKVQNGPFVQD